MFETLIAEMERQGVSRYKLARITGIADSDIYSAFSGKKPMFPKWRERISEALNCPVKSLFPEYEEEVKHE